MRHSVFDDYGDQNFINGANNKFAQFLLSKGLYDTIEITKENINDLIDLIDGKVRIDVYCKSCQTNRVFHMLPIITLHPTTPDGASYCKCKLSDDLTSIQQFIKNKERAIAPSHSVVWYWRNSQDEESRVLLCKFVCAMDESHHLDYALLINNNTLMKIGQYPSVADLTFPELDIYKKVLSKDDRANMRRAIGLFADGIGAGSYVYLRRIFENILFQAKNGADSTIDDEVFKKARVADKITMLKDFLPSTLTSNPALYGILSKGIHELSEEECLKYFPVVKDVIFMILEELESKREKEERGKKLQNSLSNIASNI